MSLSPAELVLDPLSTYERSAQRRLVLTVSALFSLVAVYFAVQSAFLHRPDQWVWTVYATVGVVVFAVSTTLALFERTARLARFVLVFVVATLVAFAGAKAGLVVATGPWAICVVLLAGVLLGRRWAVGCAVAMLLGLLVLRQLYEASGGDPALMRVPGPMSLIASAISVLVLVLGVTSLHERIQHRAAVQTRDALAKLAASHAQLQGAHAELRQLYERTVAQERLSSLGMLAAGVAHEINNPMSFISSNVHSLMLDFEAIRQDPAVADDYRTEVLPATMDGIKRVNAIISDLRRFARGDPEALVEYSLDEQVETAARLVRQHFRDGANLVLALGAPPVALGRPAQVVQVIINLLVNARQALPGPGTVTVRTFVEDAQVGLEVRDTGTGMTEEVRRRLWEPFFTTKPVGVGTGLGLPVVHGIVRDHGGAIDVQSQVGQGSVITVRLPRQPLPRVATAVGFTATAPALASEACTAEGSAKAA